MINYLERIGDLPAVRWHASPARSHDGTEKVTTFQAARNARLPWGEIHNVSRNRARTQVLLSAGAEVARLRKWHVWCLLDLAGLQMGRAKVS